MAAKPKKRRGLLVLLLLLFAGAGILAYLDSESTAPEPRTITVDIKHPALQ